MFERSIYIGFCVCFLRVLLLTRILPCPNPVNMSVTQRDPRVMAEPLMVRPSVPLPATKPAAPVQPAAAAANPEKTFGQLASKRLNPRLAMAAWREEIFSVKTWQAMLGEFIG